jgi:formylglycine-generating enzyme required for sulfatase activity
VRKLKKKLAQVNDTLYAGKYEVSNGEYNVFLHDLKKNNKHEIIAAVYIDSAGWEKRLGYFKPYVKHYHQHPNYQDYPVVNISYEGAKMYCHWLTQQYNGNKKRKFNKVLFRLPTEEEWMLAARGGNPDAVYPWEGDSLRNENREFRCNFKYVPPDGMGIASPHSDNGSITAPVAAYWPNDIDIYNMSGNVSEMILEKGRTKGGSWLDKAEAMKLDNDGRFANYTESASFIGFRYFMIVLEE